MMLMVCDSVKEVVCFGEGAGANILTRFAVSTSALYTSSNIRRLRRSFHKYAVILLIFRL